LKHVNSTLIVVAFGICLFACGTDKPSGTSTSTVATQSETKDTMETSADQPLTSSTQQAKSISQAASSTKQSLRVNDTVELEFSSPIGTFTTDEQPVPQTVWKQIALRGRHGWYQVVNDNAQWSQYHAAAAPEGDLVQIPTVGIMQDFDDSKSKKPVKLPEDDFYYNTYDVRYRTWTEYVAEDLSVLPRRQVDADFLGGEAEDGVEYYPLPYWLMKEQARLSHAKSLPAPERLTTFIELSKDTAAHTGTLSKPYRPLLTQLLRSYKAYSMPTDTASRLDQAVRSLELLMRGKGQ